MRNILDKTPKQLQKEIHGKVRAILEAPDLETARMLLKEVLEEYKEKAPKTMDILEEGLKMRQLYWNFLSSIAGDCVLQMD